jgi:Spy/CpxP family protein refolding chaperone
MSRTLSLIVVASLLSASAILAQVAPPGGMQPKQQKPPLNQPKIAPPPAPPAPPRPRYSLVTALIPYTGDESFQSELKLTEEQKSQLLAFSQTYKDTVSRAKQDESKANTPVQNEATEAFFARTLTPEQNKRALQLAAQIAWMDLGYSRYWPSLSSPNLARVSLTTLSKYPELAAALDLSTEQRQLVNATQLFSTSFLYLTPEQSQLAAALLGPAPAKPLTASSEPRVGDRGDRLESRLLALTASNDVRTELNLTPAQTEELARLRESWRTNRGKTLRESPQTQKQKFDELARETGTKLAATLQPEQLTRLKQLELRSSLPREHVFVNPDIARELGLTDAQRQAVRSASEARDELVQRTILSGGDPAAAEQRIRTAIAAKRNAIDAVLTSEQKTKIQELLGEPFGGSKVDDRAQAIMSPQAVEFGLYTNELEYLFKNTVVQEELKLTPEQIRDASAAASGLEAKYPTKVLYSPTLRGPDRQAYEERSRAIEKCIADLLTPEQARRFHQLMIQARDQLPRARFDILPVTSVAAYPGVADAIKLTAAQKDQLVGGIDPDYVLTPDQRAIIVKLKGDLVQGDLTPPNARNSLVVHGHGRYTRLLDVNWEGLKLTREQITKLVPVITRYQLAVQPSNVVQELGGAKDKLTPAVEAFDRLVSMILAPEQLNRLQQFEFQIAAAISYRAAMARPEARALALTPSQLQQIADAEAENRRWVRLAMQAQDHLPVALSLETVLLRLRDKFDSAVLAILTDEQRAKWKELMGEPWPEIRKQTQIRLGKMPPGTEL